MSQLRIKPPLVDGEHLVPGQAFIDQGCLMVFLYEKKAGRATVYECVDLTNFMWRCYVDKRPILHRPVELELTWSE
jgi:hypothetical protein